MKENLTSQEPSKKEDSFESSLQRLEQILEKMNSGSVQLDESLKLYEEADKLISLCNHKLVSAEQKIEILMKNRAGELSLGEGGKPIKEPFQPK